MKNKIFAFLLIITAVACHDDWLREEPYAIATETFYRTADEIEAALISVYAPLNSNAVFGGLYYAQLEAMTDYGYGRGSYYVVTEFQGLDETNIGRVGTMWTQFYRSIRNANLVILNAPLRSVDVDDATLNALVGEAKFIRAFAYFHLVRNWGAVPLRTPENQTDEDVPRTPVDQIYSLIVSDLEFSVMYLPENEKVMGRASKWAAKTALGHVYLQLERWSDARSEFLDVINSGRYSLINVSHPDDFYQIYGPNAESSEEIFHLRQRHEAGNQLGHFNHHPGAPYYNRTGWFAIFTDLDNKVISEWDDNDLRKDFNIYQWNIGTGPTGALFKKYIDPERDGGGNVDNPIYQYPEVLLFFAEADCRVNGAPTADGMEKLNMVRRRAYGLDPNVSSDIDFSLNDYDLESFIDLVMTERMYETMVENKRWLDLKRVGKVRTVISEAHGIDVAEKHMYWPIPRVEYNYNNAIDPATDQNPGY